MSDLGDLYGAQREQRQREGFARRLRAESDFPRARRRLAAVDIRFFRHSETHYQLRGRTSGAQSAGWLIDVFPGNRRIKRYRGAPRLELPAEWTLLDVANAAIKLQEDS